MRRSLVRLVLVAALAVIPATALNRVACAQKDGEQMRVLPQAELDVVKVLLAQERAWNEGNLEAFTSSYKNSPDTLFIGNLVTRGFEGMVATYKKNYPDRATMGRLTFSELEPHLLDERFATLTGHFALERDKKHGGNVGGVFSLVLEKTPQGWKIILDHTT
jgi:ketosteroid isomerase-like protein